MKAGALVFLCCTILCGCATQTEVELWNRPGLTQAGLDQDYAACQMYAMNLPQQQTPVTSYNATTTTIGNTSTTTVTPNPYSQLASVLGDAVVNEARQTQARRLCMQSKGYQFAGTRLQ
ncbi:MAG: hypothetical protein WCA81_17155 [Rhizomicrobium sp.]